ncbi:MAG TPA: hypothetical protein VGI39_12140 [Polyangiaceae bacterium]|jgi:hypothetical protein
MALTDCVIDATDPGYGRPLRYYVLFSDEASLKASGLEALSVEAIFCNRYYWFRSFAKSYERAHGRDAGLEQQAFKLLESAPSTVDWSVVEAIDAMVDAEISPPDAE